VHPQYVATGAPACGFDVLGQAATACSTPNSESWLNFNTNDRKWKNIITTYRRTHLE
jgi:hypothetical protein